MRILCLTYEYPPIGGGGANVAHPLAAALAGRGHTVHVVTSGMPDLPVHEVVDGVEVHRVRCRRRHRHYTTTAELLTWVWPAWRKALALHNEQPFDINHTHFAVPSGVASWLLSRRTGLPYVTTVHGSDVPGYNPDRFRLSHVLAGPVWRQVVKNSEKIVSASSFLRHLLRQSIDVPVEIIPNGFAAGFTDGIAAAKRNRILVVTRMFRRKGVQFFLEALDGLKHDWEVVIAGDGPYLPALREQVERLGLAVEFVGYVQGERLAELYATSKIFVFPSLQENFPTVLLEAMEAGCAVITTSSEGCAEVIGDAGVAVLPEHPGQIRDALHRLLNDEERIDALSARARDRIRQFRWPRIAERYEAVMLEALSSLPVQALAGTAAVTASRRK